MSNYLELVKRNKVINLYQKSSITNKLVPTIKIGKSQVLLSSTNNVLPEYYIRCSKYPKPKYEVISDSNVLGMLVDKYSEVNGDY